MNHQEAVALRILLTRRGWRCVRHIGTTGLPYCVVGYQDGVGWRLLTRAEEEE
jgi:hypothetical protein